MGRAVPILLLLLLVAVLAGCGTPTETAPTPPTGTGVEGGPGPGPAATDVVGPKEVVQAYLQAAQAKDQPGMDKQIRAEHQGKPFPRNLKQFEVTGEATIDGNEATVPAKLTFGTGETAEVQVPLIKVAGAWKVRYSKLVQELPKRA